MAINWSITIPVYDGITVPTYGNYGGPGYSDGEVLSSPAQPVDYSAPPVDALDNLFRFHDIAYDSTDKAVRAESDLALIRGIEALPREALSAEGNLYGGGAILFSLGLITVVNDQPELLTASEASLAAGTALQDIAYGLDNLEQDDQAALQSWLASVSGAALDLL